MLAKNLHRMGNVLVQGNIGLCYKLPYSFFCASVKSFQSFFQPKNIFARQTYRLHYEYICIFMFKLCLHKTCSPVGKQDNRLSTCHYHFSIMHAIGLICLFSCMCLFLSSTSNFRVASRGTWMDYSECHCVAALVFNALLILLYSNKQFFCAVLNTMHISLTRVFLFLTCRSQVDVDQFRAAWYPPIVTPARMHAEEGAWLEVGNEAYWSGSVYIENFCVTLTTPAISFSFRAEVN